jgi:hypothetical protein
VGNVDGASYDDVIIGAPNNNTGAGTAYVFLSPFSSSVANANFNLVPLTNVTGNFGYAIASGRIDNDNSYDIVVGEPAFNSYQGRASYFKGSYMTGPVFHRPNANLLGTATQTEHFGQSVAVGNLSNADGYEDVAIGAPYNGLSSSNNGKVYLYLATASGISTGQTPSAELHNQSTSERFGESVLIGRFFGASSPPAVAVGAPAAAAGGSARGSVYVFDAPLTSSTPAMTQSGSMDTEALGTCLAGGKFANDDYYRIAIGAPKFPGGAIIAGRVVILYVPEYGDVTFVVISVLCMGLGLGSRRRKSRRKAI